MAIGRNARESGKKWWKREGIGQGGEGRRGGEGREKEEGAERDGRARLERQVKLGGIVGEVAMEG